MRATPIIAPPLAELDLYCDRVASAVGRLSVRVFGDAGPAAQETAYALGRALQLTNILRDVGEDAERGRIYLPREFLDEAGIAPDPATLLAAPPCRSSAPGLRIWRRDNLPRRRRRWPAPTVSAMRPARHDGGELQAAAGDPAGAKLRLREGPGLAAEMAQAPARGAAAARQMSVHVIGAGLAGLAAACALTDRGHHVVLFEAAKAAGGRARSYVDPVLGCRIDNGNHLLLSGNIAALSYLHRIGAARSLTGPAKPVFPFIDLKSGAHWQLRLNQGGFPWWVFSRARRVPGTGLRHYAALLKLRKAGRDDLVAKLVGHGPLYRNLLEPLAIAALNTMPDIASAAPLRAVLAESIERGGLRRPAALCKDRPVGELHRPGAGMAEG